MNNQPIPVSIEAEEAILGGILFDSMAMSRVEPDLRVEAFYLQAHQEIYRAAKDLYRQQKPTDFMALVTYLSDRDLSFLLKEDPRFYRWDEFQAGFKLAG